MKKDAVAIISAIGGTGTERLDCIEIIKIYLPISLTKPK